jgi:allophanate hydrolase
MAVRGLDLASLQACYRSGGSPAALVAELDRRAAAHPDPAIWIHRLDLAALQARAAALAERDPADLPLYGAPFAVKDNIDVAGLPTTAGCPAFAYRAERTAPAVQRLLDAGAILLGKTNLDQFATGLTGTRSPYGACRNPHDPAYVAGGSSSGSAAAVAAGLVSFALGTDTAGSGRIPAAFCGLVGVKPTPGLVSTRGVVPACRSLDCVSLFATSCADAAALLAVLAGFDPDDPFARPVAMRAPPLRRLGLPRPDQRDFADDAAYAALFEQALARLGRLDLELVELDFAPFLEAAALLYEGPWLAERYHALRPLLEARPEALHPVTRAVIAPAATLSALDAFEGLYCLQELKRRARPAWERVDALVVPTAPTIWRHDQVAADPIGANRRLGTYTNFVNLMGLSALAVPAGARPDGLPFGITLIGPPGADRSLLALGARFAGETMPELTEPAEARLELAVCGAHMAGQPLNGELLRAGGRLVEAVRTSPHYRLFALSGGPPRRPGLVRMADGAAIALEVWSLPAERLGGLLGALPAPLALGRVELADGRRVLGFLCEAHAVAAAQDITAHGGWRRYLAEEAGAP